MAAYLSDELLMEVLKGLSVKSLLRMRCVRKSWYYLIQTPYFKSLHCDYQKDKHKYLLFSSPHINQYSLRFDDKQCKEYCALRFPDDVMENSSSLIKIYGTSRGLICLSGIKVNVIYICNPVLGKFISLPNSPLHRRDEVGLAFGYSAKSDDYKVIKIAVDLQAQSRFVCVCVYSLSTNSWSTVGTYKFAGFSYLEICNSVVVNGAAYWIGWKDDQSEKLIVSFDMETEIFREIMMPKTPPYAMCFVQNFGGLLSLFHYGTSSGTIYTVWVLENEAWTKKATLFPCDVYGNWCPVGFRNNGEIVLTNMNECKYSSYDLEEAKEFAEDSADIWHYENNFKYTYLHGNGMITFDPMYVSPFEENLVLLDEYR